MDVQPNYVYMVQVTLETISVMYIQNHTKCTVCSRFIQHAAVVGAVWAAMSFNIQ